LCCTHAREKEEKNRKKIRTGAWVHTGKKKRKGFLTKPHNTHLQLGEEERKHVNKKQKKEVWMTRGGNHLQLLNPGSSTSSNFIVANFLLISMLVSK